MELCSNGMALVPCSDPAILKVCSTSEAECQTEGIIYELEEREEPTLNESVIGRDNQSSADTCVQNRILDNEQKFKTKITS